MSFAVAIKLDNLRELLWVPEVKVNLSSEPDKWYFLFSPSQRKNPSPETHAILINKSWVVWKFKNKFFLDCKVNNCAVLGFGVKLKSFEVDDNTSIIE